MENSDFKFWNRLVALIVVLNIYVIVVVTKAHAVLGVGDIVYDPTMHATDTAKWSWEQVQWAEKLETLRNTLTTVRENLQTLILVKTAIGDPSTIPMVLDELMLNGALSDSGMLQTINDLGQIVRESGIIAMQLEYLSQPINLQGWKNAARMGGLYAYSYNADPLARYVAVEQQYMRYNTQLQIGAQRAAWMRSQLQMLNTRLGASSTDAETQKINGSIVTADAALQDIQSSIEFQSRQIETARTMSVNRSDQEREAYRASVDELNREVEINLELPVEDIATVTPQF
jgi:hypothetical protein